MKHLMKRTSTRYALVAVVTAMVIAPTAAIASHNFTDVPNTHTFHNNIQWMKDNGITLGCNPPANDKYCPDNAVTRGQMSAFMQRLAQNKVVDAKTALTAGHATTADSATTAATAANATNATNADKLDGLDSLGLAGIQSKGGNTSVNIAGTDLATDFTDLGTVTATAPGNGAFLYLWSAWIRCSGADEDETQLYVNGAETTLFNVEECVSSASDRSVSSTYVQAVTAGTSYTFEMRGHDWNGTPNITVHDQRSTLVFIPFGVGVGSPVITTSIGTASDTNESGN